MLNVKDLGKYIRSMRPLVPRSPEEQVALDAQGPDNLDAALARLSREDRDQARPGQGTIICLTPGLATCGARVQQSRKHRR